MPGPAKETSPLRGPLFAGVGVAVLVIGAAAGLSVLAGGAPQPVSASAEIQGVAMAQGEALAAAEIEPAETLFGGDDEVAEVSLPGVTDTESALTAPPAPAEPVRREGPRAPLPGLYESGPGGPLPVIATDGTRPDAAYAAAFNGDPAAPTIAVIVGGLGLSASLTEQAIETLPSEVTLSFAAYSDDLQSWIDRARADGHEVLIELPMEPFDYPNNDPGPHTLLAEISVEENERRLAWLLSRAAGYAGVTNYLGARLGAAEGPLTLILESLEARGLSVFHDGSGRRAVLTTAAGTANARMAVADRVVDSNPVPDAIDDRLLELEALALQNGDALGSAFAYPATVDTLAAWSEGLAARGYQLAPASFLMRVREDGAADPDA